MMEGCIASGLINPSVYSTAPSNAGSFVRIVPDFRNSDEGEVLIPSAGATCFWAEFPRADSMSRINCIIF